MRVRTLVLTAVLGTALAVPATAAADKSFEGTTKQGRAVKLTTGDDNVLKSLRINWRVKPCRSGGRSRFQDFTTFNPPYDEATPDAFSDAGAYTIRDGGGIRSRVTISVDGSRVADPANPAAETWTGSLKASVVVRRRGKVIDRCTLRRTTWKATPA